MRAELEQCRTNDSWGLFVFLAADLTLLFPAHRGELLLDDRARIGISARLEQRRTSDSRGLFAHLAADFTLLFPTHKNDLRLDDDIWEELRATFVHDRDDARGKQRKWIDVAHCARNLHILSADHAAIDNNGQIQLSYDPMPFKKTPPLPARASS